MNAQWQTYQGALLWTGNPTEPSPSAADAKAALKRTPATMFARWTSDFDCPQPTQWWYCIKDRFIPLEQMTAKQRYRIRKGLNNCEIQKLLNEEMALYAEELFQVAEKAFADYPKVYRPTMVKEEFIAWLCALPPQMHIWLCRKSGTGELIGYAICAEKDDYISLSQVKVPTEQLSTEANAAIIYRLTEYYLHECHLKFICDGERNIRHQTQYQDWLIRVCGFRYAYCQLHIVYTPVMALCINILFHFKGLVYHLGKRNRFFYNVWCVLCMEKIRRSFCKGGRNET